MMKDTEFKKMVLRMSAGVGMDTAEFYLVDSKLTEEELGDIAWHEAVAHAEMYGLEPESHREFCPEEEDTDDDRFTNDIEGYFEEYDPDEHDGLRIGNSVSWTYL